MHDLCKKTFENQSKIKFSCSRPVWLVSCIVVMFTDHDLIQIQLYNQALTTCLYEWMCHKLYIVIFIHTKHKLLAHTTSNLCCAFVFFQRFSYKISQAYLFEQICLNIVNNKVLIGL